MTQMLIKSETLDEIANAIRTKTGKTETMTPIEMARAINEPSSYAWKKYSVTPHFTSGSKGDFLSYITSDSILSYPVNGQKGDYWYELVQSNVDWGEVTLTSNQTKITVNHNLGEVPKWAGIFPNEKVQSWNYGSSYTTALGLIKNGAKWQQIRGATLYEESKTPILSNNSITFDQSYNFYPLTYYWFALGSPKSLLSILSWQQIGDLVLKAEQGTVNLSNYFSIGDTKPVTLTTGETIELQIAGFNHDTFSDGVTAPVTFIMKDCLNTKARMNSSNTNAGGYPASAMKTYVETNIYDKLPADLKALVAPIKKKWYTTYNDVNSLTEGNYNVWLLSEAEVFDSVTQTIGSGEGTKYPIFTDDASRIKKINGTNDIWWLGSCYRSSSRYFVIVGSNGIVSYDAADHSSGVAAGLCIRSGNWFENITWANGTDEEICAMVALADAGVIDLTDYWSVGDTRTVQLSAMAATGVGESHDAQVVELVLMHAGGYDLNTAVASGRSKCSFVVGMKNALAKKGYMNSSSTNSGSWSSSARRTWCNNVFKNAIPSSLLSIFKQFKTITAETYNGTTLKTNVDWFALPAAKEIYGGTASSAGDKTKYSNLTEFNALFQFDWYKTADRKKKLGTTNEYTYWWERSPSYDGSHAFCIADTGGGAPYRNANDTTIGLSPFGCI